MYVHCRHIIMYTWRSFDFCHFSVDCHKSLDEGGVHVNLKDFSKRDDLSTTEGMQTGHVIGGQECKQVVSLLVYTLFYLTINVHVNAV